MSSTQSLVSDKKLSRWLVAKIQSDPQQPRREFDPDSLDELANNMANNG